MKLTKQQLRQVIREEKLKLLSESIIDTRVVDTAIKGLVQVFTTQMQQLFVEMHPRPADRILRSRDEHSWHKQVGEVAVALEAQLKLEVEGAEKQLSDKLIAPKAGSGAADITQHMLSQARAKRWPEDQGPEHPGHPSHYKEGKS